MASDLSVPVFKDGFLILDKPLGLSSAHAVARVKRLLACRKVGHGGTLDPLASGVLPLAIGEATKAFELIASSRKSYRFTLTFGESRATDDAEGEVSATTVYYPTQEEVIAALPVFTGTIMQTPPSYSAVHVAGKRAYALARAGEVVALPPRPVEVYGWRMITHGAGIDGRLREATFEVSCGKGTYVRALGRDLALHINSLGYISMLRRTRVGKFNEAASISLDKLEQNVHNAALSGAWLTLEQALDDIPAIELDPQQAKALMHGQRLSVTHPDGRYLAVGNAVIIAHVEVTKGTLKTLRVFNR